MTVQIQKYKMLIGGEWKDSANGAVSSVLDPSNNEVVAEVPQATKQDAKAAIESAKIALESAGWVDIDPSKRGRLLTKLTTLVRENSEQLAKLETMSEGKTLRESKGDVAWAARAFEYWAGLADKVEGETIPVPPRRLNYTLREPLGVTVHIVPWNYPIALAARSLAPAIAAGNTVVVKPSEITPLTAIMLGDLALKAGIPKGVINVVTGSGAEVGEALVSDPRVDGIVFTGSAETGTQVMDNIRGLINTSPLIGWGLVLGTLAILGMPPFGVFASEFLILTTAMREQPWATPFLLLALGVAFAAVFSKVQPMVFGETTAKRLPARPAMVPVFVHLALVLMLGLWIPPVLAEWYRQAAKLIG